MSPLRNLLPHNSIPKVSQMAVVTFGEREKLVGTVEQDCREFGITVCTMRSVPSEMPNNNNQLNSN